MEYKLYPLPQSEAEIHVVLPFSEFEAHVKRAAQIISEHVEIEGFRKGKAPFDIVKNRVGESKIYEEAAEIAVRKTYAEALHKLVTSNQLLVMNPPIGKPEVTVTKLAPGSDLEYKIRLALLPNVVLPDYQKIARENRAGKKEVGVTEEEIEKTIAWLIDSRTKLIAVDRAAKERDAVEVDFEVRHGGVKIEGGESRNHPMIIGKGKFVPGFEDHLIGMRAGEEKQFTLHVPDDWYEKGLAGKMLDFSTTMKVVQDQVKPEVNDEFAKGLGNFSSLEALRASIKDGMMQEKTEKERERIRILMIEEIAKKATAEIPPVLIETEITKMLDELHAGITDMGMKWEDYLMQIKKTPEELAKGWRGDADKRVKIALSLRAIGEKEHITVGKEEIESRANQFLARFKSSGEAGKNVDQEELREYTRGVLKNEKVFELLETI